MIWSSLALNQREYNGDVAKFLELENSHQFTTGDSERERTLENVSLSHYL